MIDELFTADLWRLLLIQSTACLATGLAASFVLRRRPARAHQVLFTALLAAVLMPGLYVSARQLELGVLTPPANGFWSTPALGGASSPAEGDWATRAPLFAVEDTDEPVPLIAGPAVEVPASGAATTRVSWAVIGVACWLAVTAALLGRLILRFALGFHLLRAADPVQTDQIGNAIEKAKNRLGIDTPVQIRHSEKVRSPVIWCWVHEPVLLLHQAAGDGREDGDWVGVFCHELAHWRRRDHLSGLFAELLVAVLPWHPLLWWAKGRLLKLSEQACDDWVLATGQSGVDYAEILLGLAAERQMAFLPTVIGKEKTMNTRIRRIIKDNGSDPRIGTRWALVVGALAVCTTVGVAVAQRRPAGPEPRDPPPGREIRVEREEIVREVRERPGIDQQRAAMQRLIEQLSQQAAEKKTALGEGRDFSPEERQIREIEIKLLVEQIEQMKSRLERPGREPVVRREVRVREQKNPQEPNFEARLDSLRQRHDELAQRAQKMERELAGLKDGQNPEADELKMRLKEVHAQMLDVEARMAEQKLAQAQAERATAEQRVTRVRRNAEQVARDAQERALTDQLKLQLAQLEKQLQERKERGEGDSPEGRKLQELTRAVQERLRAKGEMRPPQERPAVTRGERRPPEPEAGRIDTRIFKLRQASPERVRDAVQSALGRSGQTSVDERTNAVIVTGTPEAMGRVEELVRQLDTPAGNRNLDAEVEDLRVQMKQMREQMQQMQKLLEQAVERGARDRPAP